MNKWLVNNFGWVIAGVFVLLIAGLVVSLEGASKNRARLMAQCMDDGKKEYECEAMLNRGGRTTVMPVPVMIGR